MAADFTSEMELAARLAREAGELTLRHFQKGVETRWKPDASPVTVADVEAEKLIRRRLHESFPDDGIVGEEEGERAGTSGRTWVIDPIDGTKSFIQGVPFYAVLIALEAGGEPVVGAVYLPALDELVHAARGAGCHWNGVGANVSTVRRLEEACVVYTSARNFERGPGGTVVRERVERATRVMRGWGDAYGYVLVATGRAEVMLDPVINRWDIAPMIPILEEAGGRFTDWSGRRGSLVASGVGTNGLLHEEVLGVLGGSAGGGD